MMLSFIAQRTPRTRTASLNPIFYEDGRTSQQFFDPSAKYMVRNKTPGTTPQHGRSFFNPPMHFHMYQTEEFQVVSGTARFFLDGKTYIRKPGEIQFIPKGAYHCFENASTTGEYLVIDFRLDKQDWEMEERFFKNFFGYLDDCRKAKQNPSIFQMFAFLYSMNAPLAIPVPGPAWMGRQVSWLVMLVMGLVIGQWLLGYRPSYEEYYHDRKKD
jgi:mannose-6-phosphate isomerase-like protein (cupin superfamily)